MRVFVTGGTGFIGSVVVQDLVAAGHRVLGLARSDASAAKLENWGSEAHRGDVTDLDGLTAGARACDGVIHMAFIHDFSQHLRNSEIDRKAVAVMAGALEGSDKPFVVTSGTAVLSSDHLGVETEAPLNPVGPRGVSEEAAMAYVGRGVRTSIVRLAPSVHDVEQQGLVTLLIALAREKGLSAYIGEGANRWPAVRRNDAARLFRLALERAKPGTRLHAVAEEGIPLRTIAEAIGEGLEVPTRSLSGDEAAAHFGGTAFFASIDNPTSSAFTREAMDWRPREAGLLAGLASGAYLS